jgi:hypothetical protein
MKGIAILGTGPAGLMAAHAVSLSGRPFSLFTLPGKDGAAHPSRIGGAQFIHKAIPTLVNESIPDFHVTYDLRGTEEEYRRKVYGDNPHVSFVSYGNVTDGEVQPAWNLHKIYGTMWDVIAGGGHSVNVEKITAATIQEWLEKDMWDFIVSTIPRHATCLGHQGLLPNPHAFLSQDVYLMNGDYANVPENTIVYNGQREPSWYRASNLQGFESVEWAESNLSNTPPWAKSKIITVSKPIAHSCDCWADDPRMIFAGRFGKWQKGVLVHDGFVTMASALMERSYL